MAKGNGATTTRRVEDRELPVKLTETELLKRGDEMADEELEIEKLKLDRRALTATINQHINKRKELAHTIERGTEDRAVRCEWYEDFPKNVWRLKRSDTGAEVDTRPMTASDRTADMFDGMKDAANDDTVPPPRRSKKPGAKKKSAAKLTLA